MVVNLYPTYKKWGRRGRGGGGEGKNIVHTLFFIFFVQKSAVREKRKGEGKEGERKEKEQGYSITNNKLTFSFYLLLSNFSSFPIFLLSNFSSFSPSNWKIDIPFYPGTSIFKTNKK